MRFCTLDKLVQPGHAAAVFDNSYFLSGLGTGFFYLISALEMVLTIAFLIGYQKHLTYGLVILLYGISTLSSWRQYLDPFDNLLFLSVWPMLAACFALYSLRDLVTRWVIRGKQVRRWSGSPIGCEIG